MPSQRRTLPANRPPTATSAASTTCATAPPRAAHPWDLASEAADAIRLLDHALYYEGAYRDPADLDVVLVELGLLASRLPQAFGHARTWLAARLADGLLTHDTYPARTAATVSTIDAELVDAVLTAQALADAVDRARQHTAHLRFRSAPISPSASPTAGPADADGVR